MSRDLYEDGDYRGKGNGKRNGNVLLMRNPLGRVKPAAYPLPNEDFVYGRVDNGDAEGARDVVQSWQKPADEVPPTMGRDFVRLNKNSAKGGATTSKGFSQYRKQHDIRMKSKEKYVKKEKQPNLPKRFQDPEVCFGQKSQYSEPIANILSNEFQRKWISNQRNTEAQAAANRKTSKLGKVQRNITKFHTKASLGHLKPSPKAEKPMYKLKQFANVKAKVTQYMVRPKVEIVVEVQAQQEPREEPSMQQLGQSQVLTIE